MSKGFSVSTKYSTAIPRSQRRKGVEGRGGATTVGATGGWATRSYVDDNFVNLTSDQAVRGRKNFADGISMYGIPWEYDVEKDAWTIKGNVIITRGLAVYSTLNDEDIISVYDGIPIDGQTLQWQETEDGKVLVAVGGGSGGGLDEDKLQDYLDEKKYATQDWVTGKNYALQSITITAGTGLTGGGTLAANRTLSLATVGTAGTYAKVTTDAYGRVTSGATLSALDIPNLSWSKITSGKPTTLSGYGITDAYTKTEVGENFLAIDGIAERAKILAGSLTATSYMLFSGNELNHCNNGATNNFWFGYRQPSGSARTTNKWLFSSSSSSKLPDGDIQAGRLRLGSTDTNIPSPRYTLDVEGDASVEGTFYLNGAPMTYNSSKNAWQIDGNLIVTGGIAAYTKLSGFTDLDVMGGVVVDGETITIENGALKVIGGTSSGGSVSITGAASTIVSSNLTASRALISNSSGKVAVSSITSTKLGYLTDVTSNIQAQINDKQATLVSGTNIKTINGTSILGSGNITISGGSSSGDYLPLTGGDVSDTIRLTKSLTSSFAGAQLKFGPSDYARISANNDGSLYLFGKALYFYPYSTTSATTTRMMTLGTDGNLTVAGNILPFVNSSITSNTFSIGAAGAEWQTVYARSIQAKAGWGIRFYTGASGTTPTSKMIVGTSGRVGIGTESASELLHVAGNIYTTGTVTENSARKLKNVDYEGEGISLDVLKKVKVAKWHWKDKRDERQHIGAIADDLVNIIPEVVIESEDENGVKNTGIAYGKAGFSIAASLIAPVTRHEDRIKELEKDIEKMQKELDKLKKTA